MGVTIKDVAKRAKVAPSTVSRVIADHPKITQETKERVRRIMDELGYHPNLLARNLVRQSSQTIGIVTKETTKHSLYDPFFPAALKGMGNLLHEKDYSIQLTTGETKEEIYQEVVKMVQGKNVDGIIVLYSRDDDPVLTYLLDCDFPFVMLGKPTVHVNEIMYVDNDNVKAAREITEHLLSIGHRQIAYIGGDLKFEVHKDREQGYREALQMAGVQETLIFRESITKESGEKIVEQLLKMKHRPTAVVTTDELMCLSILSALYAKGLRVPEDIAITTFTDSLISELASPPLTTVNINPFQLGYEAAKSLVELLQDPDMMKRNILVPTSIVTRESCKKITENEAVI